MAMRKSGVLAFLFSILQVGAGHLYAGHPRRGGWIFGVALSLGILLLTGLSGSAFPLAAATLAILAGLTLFAAFDAARLARKPRPSDPLLQRWYVVLPLCLAVQLVVVLAVPRVQRVKSFVVPASSMEPTVEVGDRFVAALGWPKSRALRRGEIVIFEAPDRPGSLLVKRAVAVPGDSVEIRDKTLLVNGKEPEEPWVVHRDAYTARDRDMPWAKIARDQFGPVTVPADQFFALGDNRDYSYDSRFFGFVPLESLRARPLYFYWSTKRERIGARVGD